MLLASAAAAAALLGAVAVLPAGAPLPALVALAAANGLATPPLAASMRALVPGLLTDPGAVRAAYAFALAGGAGVVAVLATLLRFGGLRPEPRPATA